jgi:type II secretory pathway component PulK
MTSSSDYIQWHGEIAALHVRMKRGLYEDVEAMLEILAAHIDQALVELAEAELEEVLADDEEDQLAQYEDLPWLHEEE